ncbi:hypothetical protein [Luteimonas terrae]|uniref:Uncharacterized protein n=1 Tax=Luteimonas terrae TaxID=1530191 RepID=A0ABU1XX45_9GAMM|nr:hypothetical protein [Luteimonas terrae]MDR7192696.1 hypothetical protein [Luteimonas terrae]
MVSALHKLRSWMTVEDVAESLTALAGEPVKVADILALALDGHVVLSVNIVNGQSAKLGAIVDKGSASYRLVALPGRDPSIPLPDVSGFPEEGDRRQQEAWCEANEQNLEGIALIPKAQFIGESGWYEFPRKISTIRGLWDLTMEGAERLDVQHALNFETGAGDVTDVNLEGVLLKDPNSDTVAWLHTHFSENEFCKDRDDRKKYPYGQESSYFPSGGIPEEFALVVRSAEFSKLCGLVASVPDEGGDRSSAMRSDLKQNYEIIIAALWKKAHGDGGPGAISSSHYTAASSLVAVLELEGVRGPSADSVGRILKSAKAHLKIGTS